MVGKWIVYEGVILNRWVAREVVGDTDKFWLVQAYRPDGTCDDIPVKRVKKESLGRHLVTGDRCTAEAAAANVTAEIEALGKIYMDAVKDVYSRHLGDTQ